MDSFDRITLIEMAQGYFRSKVLLTMVNLGIADVLKDDEKSLDEIATETHSNRDSLIRLLRALAAINVVRETKPAHFILTEFGQPLRKDADKSVWASIIFWADLLADSWNYLPDCVRTGDRSGADQAREREGVPSRWSRVSNATEIFHLVFAEPTAEDMEPLAESYDFSSCHVVADLGGAGGALLSAILISNPHVSGILVDKPEAIQQALPKIETYGLSTRCQLLPGDLIECIPKEADTYIMKNVLHGYDYDKAKHILQNCHTAMKAGGRLLIIEVVLPELIDHASPEIEKILMGDLNMLAVTSGRERNETEWTLLLESSNFDLQRIIPVPGMLSIIEVAPQS